MNGIEKAGYIKDLLIAKEQLQNAEPKEAGKLVAKILRIRQLLGMAINAMFAVVGRIKKNPVDLQKDLTTEEYQEQIKSWLPDMYVNLTSVDMANAKGIAIALQEVMEKYPALSHEKEKFHLICKSDEANKVHRKTKKICEAKIKEFIDDNNLLEAAKREVESHAKYLQFIRENLLFRWERMPIEVKKAEIKNSSHLKKNIQIARKSKEICIDGQCFS